MKFSQTTIFLGIIIGLGLMLRIIFPSLSPPALNIDEAALGYNAFSILKTGADEHGVKLPLILESFGDWKLPLYSYITVPFIAIFGLSEFSTRIPSIFSGVLGILLIFLIAKKLFTDDRVGLISSLFFAFSPWSIYFSRAAYEVNVATTLFLCGVYFFLLFLGNLRLKYSLFLSGLFFGLTNFTYHSFIVFSPVFVLFLTVWKWRIAKKNIIVFLLPFLFFLIISLWVNYSSGISKFQTTTVFSNENIIYERVDNFKKDSLGQNFLFDVIHTKYLGIPYHLSQNYLMSFSPKFLFDGGGEKLVHNAPGFGNLYILDALFIASGVFFLILNKQKNSLLLLVWILVSPLSSSLTIDSPNSTRLFMIMPAFILVSAYGVYHLILHLKKHLMGKVILTVILLLFILNVMYFLNIYFFHLPYHRALFWRYGNRQIVELTSKYPNSSVVMRGPENFPYIYFLFYNKYDPKKFQEEVEYYPTTTEGFKYVKSFGRYSFVPALVDVVEVQGKLYVDDQNFGEGDNKIMLPNGDPVYKYYFGK